MIVIILVLLAAGAIIPPTIKLIYRSCCKLKEIIIGLRNINGLSSELDPNSKLARFGRWCKSKFRPFKSAVICVYNYAVTRVRMRLYSPTKMDKKNCYYTEFYHSSNLYRVPLLITRGIMDKPQFKDINGVDISDQILPFAGPNYNFYGMDITPQFFNLTELTVIRNEVETKIYANEKII